MSVGRNLRRMAESLSGLATQPRMSARNYSTAASVAMIVPLLVAFGLGFFYPVARLITMSFEDGLDAYRRIFAEALYIDVLVTTAALAALVSALCIGLGYPVAWAMARSRPRIGALIAACVFIPLWTSVLIRSYAWIVLLQRQGLVNALIQTLGLSDQPVKLLYTQGAVVLAMTHVLMPFAILPIYSNLKTLPGDLERAASSLGANRLKAFAFVILPLSLPGVFAAAILTFVMALGFYITPALLGGPGSMLMSTLIGQQTTVVLDWPFAAALSTTLLALTLVIVGAFHRLLKISKGFDHVQ